MYLEAGGLARIRVVDDGAGMSEEDLSLCWQPHATSKIETEDDLLTASSLGFRGEALSSIALCSRLVMVSCNEEGAAAHRLEVLGGRLSALEKSQGRRGTVVDVSELFFNYPARRKFLRSASSESGLCRSIFVDRAAAHPALSFRLFSEGQVRVSLLPASPLERIAHAYAEQVDARMLHETAEAGEGFSVRVVAGSPDVRRRDRKLLQCFVNKRRVTEFSLLQAVEFGFTGYMPGGWHPAAFVFVDIDPGPRGFQHPSREEGGAVPQPPRGPPRRCRGGQEDARSRRHRHRRHLHLQAAGRPRWKAAGGTFRSLTPTSMMRRARFPPALQPLRPDASLPDASGIRFLGQVFGVFLLFELPGRLLMMDQHAAHERILYERLSARAPEMQEMLFPLCFDVTDDEEARLLEAGGELAGIGISLRRAGARALEVTALAADLKPLPEGTLVEMIRGVGAAEWKHSLIATAACRLAVKEGDRVDPVTAHELCVQALRLPVPRCPHGRPIWHELSEETLLKLVDRPLKERTPRDA